MSIIMKGLGLLTGKKPPKELVRDAVECLKVIAKDPEQTPVKDSKQQKASEDCGKLLSGIKQLLLGNAATTEKEEPKKSDINDIAKEANDTDFLLLLVQYLEHLDFESRKDGMIIFNFLVKYQLNGRFTTVDYICEHPQMLSLLLSGYEKSEVSLLCGSMLRECFKHEILTKKMLFSCEDVYKLFIYVDNSNFEMQSDAFVTFKELLTSRHKAIVAEFLETNFDKFFTEYNNLLNSKNYVTKRQSLKILGEIILDRSNFNVMSKYINDRSNLKLMMNLLLDKRKNIQFEAFHVFKVFIANPHKSAQVRDIIRLNREKLINYLRDFQTEREKDDEQFLEEKSQLISILLNEKDTDTKENQ
ncbi:calcium binding protein 39-like protein [Naegleria gruberi]|uniref:Calcium binding protein 39-like protein n=1 Tax=Naegleria gruberi TaxID=5762 RepID=D2VE01_NAEGR|nr:calcium binding protein 39-like protein [Naegleria gruberi]EFC44989.1 calcium binding protein 39-like protein [Naegleria gruberi]|eukprot:XP_002677733.1 calcium binding protein 39-like protein [Naegleria gruberi strain NEG-M]